MSWRERILINAKKALAPVLYRRPPVGLREDKLYVYLDALYHTREVQGASLEIGCYLGGTAAVAHRFLEQVGAHRQYLCIDTFQGFVEEQFETDRADGTPPALARMFSVSDKSLVTSTLR